LYNESEFSLMADTPWSWCHLKPIGLCVLYDCSALVGTGGWGRLVDGASYWVGQDIRRLALSLSGCH